jgi:Glycosyl hydrolases family 39
MARFCGPTLLLILTGALLDPAFAADLQAPNVTIPSSYFGLHIHHLAYPVPTPWPNMPVPEWRIWDADVTWADIEPSKGQWRFEKLDGYVSLAQQHGTGILLTLGGSPRWASVRPNEPSNYSPGFTAEPLSIDDWRSYVKTVTLRYKGRIQAYEIWNEPNLPDYWSGTTDQMLTLTKEASLIIRGVDPQALVVSPSATADYGIPWLAEFLKKGGGQYVDVIGFHFYVNPHTLPPEDMLPVIQHVHEVLADNGLANKPVWNTETGWLEPAKFDSDELAAGFLARAFILSWAAGIQRFYWYGWDNQFMAIVTYKESARTITPAGSAYKIVEQWLVGTMMQSCTSTSDYTWMCQLNRSGKKEWIVWNTRGNHKFEVPRTWSVARSTTLLQDSHPLSGSNVDIGPVPALFTSR